MDPLDPRVNVSDLQGASPAEFLAAFAIAAAAGTAVFFHAERNHISRPSAWASFVFLFLMVGLPAYAIHVHRVRKRQQSPPT